MRSALILECDSQTLRSQGDTFAQDLTTIIENLAPRFPHQHIRTTTDRQLLAQLSQLAPRTFSTVAAIGHSNRSGLKLTQDPLTPWDVFGMWIRPFSPNVVFLGACEAGRWLPSKAIFESVPTVTSIYASPTPTNHRELALYAILIPLALHGIKIPRELLLALRFMNFLETGGWIYCHTREDFARAKPFEVKQWEVIDDLAAILRSARGRR